MIRNYGRHGEAVGNAAKGVIRLPREPVAESQRILVVARGVSHVPVSPGCVSHPLLRAHPGRRVAAVAAPRGRLQGAPTRPRSALGSWGSSRSYPGACRLRSFRRTRNRVKHFGFSGRIALPFTSFERVVPVSPPPTTSPNDVPTSCAPGAHRCGTVSAGHARCTRAPTRP